MSWFAALPGCETQVLAFCRRCVCWDALPDDDLRAFDDWKKTHRCAAPIRQRTNGEELDDFFSDGWAVTSQGF